MIPLKLNLDLSKQIMLDMEEHLDVEITLSTREYLLLKAIIKGEYESIDMKDWNVFFSLYKKEAISFI